MHYTVEIQTRPTCPCPAGPACADPALWTATSTTGPKWLRGYALSSASATTAAEGVERAIRAVFPQHSFDFNRTPV